MAIVRIPPGYLREKTDLIDFYVRLAEAGRHLRIAELEEIRSNAKAIAKEAERWLGEEVEG